MAGASPVGDEGCKDRAHIEGVPRTTGPPPRGPLRPPRPIAWAACALLAACAGSPTVERPGGEAAAGPADLPLTGTHWRLVELGGEPVPAAREFREAFVRLVPAGAPDGDPDEDRLAASGGCNSMGGTFELGTNGLRILPGPMTLMACAEPVMDQERAFVAMLREATGHRIDGRTLELTGAGGVLARFEAGQAE